MKYDIPTLLALSRNACIDSERFSTQAANSMQTLQFAPVLRFSETNVIIQDNLLRPHKPRKSVLAERSNNSANELPNASSRRMANRSASGTHFKRPSRQPHDPPQGVFAQSDSGFERFLKEHSSPRHQRVTAAGRIVPMKQLAPAPMIKLPVNQESTMSGVQVHDESQLPLGATAQPMGQDQNTNHCPSTSLHPAALTDYASFMGVNGNLVPQLQIPGLFPNFPHCGITPAMILPPQLSLQPGTQQSFRPEHQSMDSLPVFPNVAGHGIGADQMALHQNMNSNCPAAIVPFMACHAGSSASRDSSELSTGSNLNKIASAYNSITKGSDPFYNPTELSTPRTPTPQALMTSQTRTSSNVSREVSPFQKLQNVTKEYSSLSVQLSRLDRYTAVHTWDMDPRQKRIVVEQRMSLVRELDVIRTYKEQLETLCEQLKPKPSENTRKSSVLGTSEHPSSKHGSSISMHVSGAAIPQTASASQTEKHAKNSSISRSTGQQSKPEQQRQNTGAMYAPNDGPKSMSIPGSREPQSRDKASLRGQSLNKTSTPDNRNSQGVTGDPNCLAGTSEGSNEVVTIPQPAPSGIRKLYRDIEEGIKRGSPIDGLLQELAATTTRSSPRYSENNGIMLRLSSNEGASESGDATGPAIPSAIDDDSQSARLAARRPWASENQPRPTAEMNEETDYEDDDGGSWSSYDSTEDSWDTVQEGE